MKKNITVNIFGTLYPIDEDAYELLQRYNENMRRYYSHREGGEEIADDVEHRVAELLSEYRSQGVMAITIEHVTEIINRIGDPQQMDTEANEETEGATPPPFEGNQANSNSQNSQGNPGNPGDPNAQMGYSTLNRKIFRDGEIQHQSAAVLFSAFRIETSQHIRQFSDLSLRLGAFADLFDL